MSNAGNKRKLGCISFGYIFFVQAKKSNSPRGEKQRPNHPKNYLNDNFQQDITRDDFLNTLICRLQTHLHSLWLRLYKSGAANTCYFLSALWLPDA
jgi:hypothetical protein